MAPIGDLLLPLAKRYYCSSGQYYSNGSCYNNSSWYYWGRWVLAGIIIFVVLLAIVCLGCINSRRRRRQGLMPRYGTGWMSAGPKFGQQNHEMYPPNNYQPGPPPYQPQQQQFTGSTFNPNDGYYGGHQQGVQYPENSYQRDNVYAPPAGPPPGK